MLTLLVTHTDINTPFSFVSPGPCPEKGLEEKLQLIPVKNRRGEESLANTTHMLTVPKDTSAKKNSFGAYVFIIIHK